MDLDKLEKKLEMLGWEQCNHCFGVSSEGSLCLDCLGSGIIQDFKSLSRKEQVELIAYARELEGKLL